MRRMNRKTLAVVLMGSLALAGASLAAERLDPRAELLQRYDANKNGQLEDSEREAMRAEHQKLRAEMQKLREEARAKFDTNKDGQLDDTERKALRAARTAERFKALDKDGNGSLSLAEFQAGADRADHGGHGRHGRH